MGLRVDLPGHMTDSPILKAARATQGRQTNANQGVSSSKACGFRLFT